MTMTICTFVSITYIYKIKYNYESSKEKSAMHFKLGGIKLVKRTHVMININNINWQKLKCTTTTK